MTNKEKVNNIKNHDFGKINEVVARVAKINNTDIQIHSSEREKIFLEEERNTSSNNSQKIRTVDIEQLVDQKAIREKDRYDNKNQSD